MRLPPITHGVQSEGRCHDCGRGRDRGVRHALETLSSSFSSWDGSPRAVDFENRLVPTTLRSSPRRRFPARARPTLPVGVATIPRGHPDYYALDVGNLILGRLGLMGRLGAEVRDRQGLAYYASSQLEPRRDGTLWAARAGVDPENIERALLAIKRSSTGCAGNSCPIRSWRTRRAT